MDQVQQMIEYVEAEAAGLRTIAVAQPAHEAFLSAWARAFEWAARELRAGASVQMVIALAERTAEQQAHLVGYEGARGASFGYEQLASELSLAQRHPEMLAIWQRATAVEVREMCRPAAAPVPA